MGQVIFRGVSWTEWTVLEEMVMGHWSGDAETPFRLSYLSVVEQVFIQSGCVRLSASVGLPGQLCSAGIVMADSFSRMTWSARIVMADSLSRITWSLVVGIVMAVSAG